MKLESLPIAELIAKLGYGDDVLRTDVVDELTRRAKKGDPISEAISALTETAEKDDVLGVRQGAREALNEAKKSARGENDLPAKLVALIERKDWEGIEQLVMDKHIGYEVRNILEGRIEPKQVSERLLRTIEVNQIDIQTLPRVVSGIILTAQRREIAPGISRNAVQGNGRQLERR